VYTGAVRLKKATQPYITAYQFPLLITLIKYGYVFRCPAPPPAPGFHRTPFSSRSASPHHDLKLVLARDISLAGSAACAQRTKLVSAIFGRIR
jgi:hypothetical protein